MKIAEVIQAIQRMHSEGIIDDYAIGGAVGATFYLEPISTLDVDIFVSFVGPEGGGLINPQPVFDYLGSLGYAMDGEYIMIGGWPVQLLPSTGPLVDEALQKARTIDVGGVFTRVFSAEHLAAIALETGRAKDKARLLQFVESNVLDISQFEAIISSYNLDPQWEKFQTQFLEDSE